MRRSLFLIASTWATVGTLLVYMPTFGYAATRIIHDDEIQPLKEQDRVIRIFANQGPYGQLYLPKEIVEAGGQFKPINQPVQAEFIFPSVYYLISAQPKIEVGKQGYKDKAQKKVDWTFIGTGLDLSWLDLTVSMIPIGCSDKTQLKGLKEEDKAKLIQDLKVKGQALVDAGAIRILGLLPDETLAQTVAPAPSEATQIAGTAKQFIDAVVPSFLSAGLGGRVRAAADGANVLFKDLVSPQKLTTYRYSFIENQAKFGWIWRNNPAEKISLLGIRRGIVLLQVDKKKVDSVLFSYRIKAKWNQDVSKTLDDEYVDIIQDDQVIDFSTGGSCPEETSNSTLTDRESFTSNYRHLKNLENFPMLIPKDAVCAIFQQWDKGEEKCDEWFTENIKGKHAINIYIGYRPRRNIKELEVEEIELVLRKDLEPLLGLR